ncbi:MAG: hypothetical protein KF906_12890 [Actinobacteria bacterium]|nr:hypothetical protein [Actinomycetota bacterium]
MAFVAMGVILVVASVVALIGGRIIAGAGALVMAVYLLRVGWVLRCSTETLLGLPAGPGALVLTDRTITVVHPVLCEEMTVPIEMVRGFAVDVSLPRRPRFPIERALGSIHALDEPRSFIVDEKQLSLGKSGVDLLAVSLEWNHRWTPNVAVLFAQPLAVTFLGPGPFQPLARTPIEVNRVSHRRAVPGVYLSVVDPDRVRTALRHGGVREGFTSEDWRIATGRAAAPDGAQARNE